MQYFCQLFQKEEKSASSFCEPNENLQFSIGNNVNVYRRYGGSDNALVIKKGELNSFIKKIQEVNVALGRRFTVGNLSKAFQVVREQRMYCCVSKKDKNRMIKQFYFHKEESPCECETIVLCSRFSDVRDKWSRGFPPGTLTKKKRS